MKNPSERTPRSYDRVAARQRGVAGLCVIVGVLHPRRHVRRGAEEVTGSIVDRQQILDLTAQGVVVATDAVDKRRAVTARLEYKYFHVCADYG